MHIKIIIMLVVVAFFSLQFADSYAVVCEGLAKVGDRVGIKYAIANSQTVESPYVSIVQIKDSNGITVQLSWLVGILEPNQEMDVIQSWVPEEIGRYVAEVFMWESSDNPVPLSPIKTLQINVNC